MFAGIPYAEGQAVLGPDLANAAYHAPENTFARGECTWYVFGRVLEARGIRLLFSEIEGRDAYRWSEFLSPAYVRSSTPQAGAMALWTHNKLAQYGHVAYVERVSGDLISFTEGNFSADPAAEYGFDGVETLAREDFEKNRCGRVGCWTFQGYVIPAQSWTDETAAKLDFLGVTRDAISIRDAARPDGQLDGEFRLELGPAVQGRIVGLTLLLVDGDYNPILGQVWDTEPGGYWMLGVTKDGVWANPGDESIGIDVTAGTELRLFASDSGYFLPGFKYQLRVRFVDSAELTVTVAMPESTADLEQSEGLTFEYLGVGPDVMGIRGPVQPDGHKDGVFSLSIVAEDEDIVSNIEIHLVDNAGSEIFGQVWDTQPAGYWMIGVYRHGQIVNPLDESLQLGLSGSEQFLLYASDSGHFQPGNRFRVTVTSSDGLRRVGYTVVPSTESEDGVHDDAPDASVLGACGSSSLELVGIPDYLFFERPLGVNVGKPVYFGRACLKHDGCYARAGSTKSTCDREFAELLKATCDETLVGALWSLGRTKCRLAAEGYFQVVSRLGCDAFSVAQKTAGTADPSCD